MRDNPVPHRRTRSVRRIITAIAALLVAVGVQFASPVAVYAATGDAQLLVVSNNSANLSHTIRSANGAWTGFGNVESQAGQLGNIPDTAGVLISGALHTLAVSSVDGGLYHTIRNVDGSWTGFGNVENQAGQIGTVTGVAAANVGGLLHVVARTSTGGLFHAIRNANGSWTGFGDVKGQAGDPGFVTDVTAAGFANGQLQVVVTVAGGGLFHTIRFADGSWQSFADVKLPAGNPGSATRVSDASVGGNLHVVVAVSGGGLFHAIRFADGSWQPFANVKLPAGDPGPVFDVGSAGFPDGQLQVVVSTNNGGLFHTIRFADGSWQLFANVKLPAGDPGPVTRVSIAGE